ncbi:MAG: thioredoxin family protein [Patescibacteria group bacterium]
MNNKIIAIAVTALVVIGGVIMYANRPGTAPVDTSDSMMNEDSNVPADAMMGDEATEEGEKMMLDDGTSKDKNSMMEQKDDSAMMKSSAGTYVDFSPEVLAAAQNEQKEGRKIVLFFHAAWCPFCIAADKDFRETLAMNSFPANVTLIKTDYDTQKELKKKYGVTNQHTFVQIDSNGNQITKWVSGETASLIANVR